MKLWPWIKTIQALYKMCLSVYMKVCGEVGKGVCEMLERKNTEEIMGITQRDKKRECGK